MEEESEQLNEVEENITIFFLHPYDIGQGEGPIGIDASVRRGGPWKETKLEKVLHHNSQLWEPEERDGDHDRDGAEVIVTFLKTGNGKTFFLHIHNPLLFKRKKKKKIM